MHALRSYFIDRIFTLIITTARLHLASSTRRHSARGGRSSRRDLAAALDQSGGCERGCRQSANERSPRRTMLLSLFEGWSAVADISGSADQLVSVFSSLV